MKELMDDTGKGIILISKFKIFKLKRFSLCKSVILCNKKKTYQILQQIRKLEISSATTISYKVILKHIYFYIKKCKID